MVRIKDVYLQYVHKRTDSFRHNSLSDYNIVAVPETDSSTVVDFEVLVEGKPYGRFEGVEVNPWTQGVGTALVTFINNRWIRTVQDLLEYAGKPSTASSVTFTLKLNTSAKSLTVPINISESEKEPDSKESDSKNLSIDDLYLYNVETKQRVTEIPINDPASNYRYSYTLSNVGQNRRYIFEISAIVGSNRKQLFYFKNMGFAGDGSYGHSFNTAENYSVKFETVKDLANYIGAKAGDTVIIEFVFKPMNNPSVVIKKSTSFKLIEPEKEEPEKYELEVKTGEEEKTKVEEEPKVEEQPKIEEQPKTGLPSVTTVYEKTTTTTTTSGPAQIELSEETRNFILIILGVIAGLTLLVLIVK